MEQENNLQIIQTIPLLYINTLFINIYTIINHHPSF